MSNTWIILSSFCLLLSNFATQTITIRIPLAGDIDEVTFDPSRVSPEEVKRWIQFSPNVGSYNGFLIPENVELCDSSDPRYEGCGKTQKQVNFHNAQLNIDKIRERNDHLDPSYYPADLSTVVLYVKRIQMFGLWRDTQLLTFEKRGRLPILGSKFEGINPKLSCGTILTRIAKAETRQKRSQLARFDWSNCVWDAEKEQIGPFPKEAWQKFLANHGIREHYIQEAPSD